MSKDRFILLDADASRPSRTPLPPSVTVKAGADDTEGRFSLLEIRGEGAALLHLHDTFDEFVHALHAVYVLEGELGVEVDGTTHRLTSGMSALLPCGIAHTLRSLSDAPVHVLQLSAPGDKGNAVVLDRGEARPGRVPVPPAFAVKARADDTEGRFSLLEVTVAQAIPRHVHHEAEEGVYVLDGELTVEFDDREHTATRGQFVLLPHGVPHALRPGSGRPPKVIQISAPGGWECFVEDLIEARAEVGAGGRLDPAKLNAVAAKYQITYEE
ncbi:cupin domain-containing protein [Streptomyces sp. NPDC059063]|uniref:cupin domain-containing protein n=1 Tax=unclassified Streptomyces TaxID=2593676 RepID=UPI003677B9A9